MVDWVTGTRFLAKWVSGPSGAVISGRATSLVRVSWLQQRLIGAEPARAFPPTLGTLDAKPVRGQQKALTYCPRLRVLCANERGTKGLARRRYPHRYLAG
jgi:hypothetical protein